MKGLLGLGPDLGPEDVGAERAQELRNAHPEVVIVHPQIPQNTGSIARLCAAFQMRLHLIEPMGFQICEKKVRRAGLDYWPYVDVQVHGSWAHYRALDPSRRCVFVETGSHRSPADFSFSFKDVLVFGSETKGLPCPLMEQEMAAGQGQIVTIPMFCHGVRSINLSNAAAIVMYQALAHLYGKGPKAETP